MLLLEVHFYYIIFKCSDDTNNNFSLYVAQFSPSASPMRWVLGGLFELLMMRGSKISVEKAWEMECGWKIQSCALAA